MKVILLSGPPGAGKNTVADILHRKYDVYETAFAKPLKLAMGGLLGVDHEQELELLKRADPRVRDLMIGLSEDVVKPVMSIYWFAEHCAEQLFEHNILDIEKIVVTDTGFNYEKNRFIERMREYYGEEAQFQNWAVERPGHDYTNDSREPIVLEPEQGDNFVLPNRNTPAGLEYMTLRLASAFWGDFDK